MSVCHAFSKIMQMSHRVAQMGFLIFSNFDSNILKCMKGQFPWSYISEKKFRPTKLRCNAKLKENSKRHFKSSAHSANSFNNLQEIKKDNKGTWCQTDIQTVSRHDNCVV